MLTGLMAAGKTTVAGTLASRFGVRAEDSDALVEQTAGRSIAEIFAEDGETAFRALELEAVRSLLADESVRVVSLGGGAFMNAEVRAACRAAGAHVVYLHASPSSLAGRLGPEGIAARPLLHSDPLERLTELYDRRDPTYREADEVIETEGCTVDALVERLRPYVQDQEPAGVKMQSWDDVKVDLGARSYSVRTEVGDAAAVAAHVDEFVPGGRLLVLSDSNVAPLHGAPLAAALASRGRGVRQLEVAAGEASKSLATMERLWDEALAEDFDRGDVVVAVGGGVVGDIGGFLASTLLRGVRLVQVPTSVLAMADAAVGGKTGINTRHGKNLVGTFHQPAGVVQWVGALETLAPREVASGLAEVVKSALLAGEAEFAELESRSAGLAAARLEDLSWAVRMAAAVKADIVSRDELEGGARRLLNFGHTFGHVIEHATGYGSWTHGEAVSAGMVLALRHGTGRGIGDKSLLSRVVSVLEEQKLPVRAPSLTLQQWTTPLRVDKKREGDTVKLILCARPGDCRVVPTPMAELVDWLRTL